MARIFKGPILQTKFYTTNQSHYAYFKNIAYRDLRSLKPFLMSDQYFARQAENFDLIL